MPLLGTQPDAIDLAEDRGRFGALLERARPQGAAVRDRALARRRRWPPRPRVGFPLLVRPSYVLGGRAMELVYWPTGCATTCAGALRRRAAALRSRAAPHGGTPGRAIFLDRFLENAIEVDVDAICDGEDVWIGGIMQHVEEAGIHSGDSACVLPPHSLGDGDARRDPPGHARHRARARRRRADQRPVRRARRGPLRDRGQPARVADGAVRLQGDRPAARQARLPGDARREARRPRRCRRIRTPATCPSRRPCCRSTASRAPTRCSARRCARRAR